MLTEFRMYFALLQSQLEAKDKEITKARKVAELNFQHSGIFLQDYTQFFWNKLIRTSPPFYYNGRNLQQALRSMRIRLPNRQQQLQDLSLQKPVLKKS